VGEQIRCKHPHDSGRASVVIRNTETSYSAYCHRRNTGDTVHKAHVIPRVAPQGSEHDSIPKDLVYVETLPNHQQRQIYSYVLTKGVSPEMLPRLKWTESRKRIIFETSQGIVLGRDITDSSHCKWVDYTPNITNHSALAEVGWGSKHIVVEDLLSMFKVGYCLDLTEYSVTALLGTRLTDLHKLTILRKDKVLIFLDGDHAGKLGSFKVLRECRSIGINAKIIPTPSNKDPKDLRMQEIREMIWTYS